MAAFDEVSARIAEYKNRAHVTRRSHYLASTRAESKSSWLGVPIVIITAVVGTSIFSTLQDNPSVYLKIFAGILSISATVLAALQTYLGYAERAATHKQAGARYAAVWRSLDVLDLELKNSGEPFCDTAIVQLKEIVTVLNEAAQESPSVPDRVYEIAADELRAKLKEQSKRNS